MFAPYEFVAVTPYGNYVFGIAGGGFYRFAYFSYMDVQSAISREFVFPDVIKNFLLGDDSVFIFYKIGQQFEFKSCKLCGTAIYNSLLGVEINCQPAVRIGRIGTAITFQNSLYLCKQYAERVGLLNIIIAAYVQRDDFVVVA